MVGLELGLELDHIHFGGRLSLELRLEARYCLGTALSLGRRTGLCFTLLSGSSLVVLFPPL